MFGIVEPARGQTAETIQAAQKAGDVLIGMGPFGALLVLLLVGAGIIITVLWRDNLRLRARNDTDQEAREARDDARFGEVKTLGESTASALAKAAVAELAMGSALAHTNDLVEKQGDLIDARTANFNELKAGQALLELSMRSLKDSFDELRRRVDR